MKDKHEAGKSVPPAVVEFALLDRKELISDNADLRARLAKYEDDQGNPKATPSAKWKADGEPDPHAGRYDCERAELAMGDLTDDELANGAFMNYDAPLNLAGILAGTHSSPIAWMTAVKDRIRWLSRSLEQARAALSAPSHGEQVRGGPTDAERLAFMLDCNRKVMVERLPSSGEVGRLEVYVEEGFLGDKWYPSVGFTGEWSADPQARLEIKRRAIDLAIAAAPSAGSQGGDV